MESLSVLMVGAFFLLIIVDELIKKLDIPKEYSAFAVFFMFISIVVIFFGGIIIKDKNNEKKRKKIEQEEQLKRQRQEQKEQLKRYKQEQKSYYSSMIYYGNESLNLFESMPNKLNEVENYLDQAEIDFKDNALTPFWDSIEKAAKMLGNFYECINEINANFYQYTTMMRKYDNSPPVFPISPASINKLDVSSKTTNRMNNIVRKAQCIYEFASIYEKRRTNQILIGGFKNLAQVLEGISHQIFSSVEDLSKSIRTESSAINNSLHSINSQMNHFNTKYTAEVSERANREKKVLEKLDNIQRRRKPIF